MPRFIENANVRIVSDGKLTGTHAYLVEEDGTEHEIVPVVGATWHCTPYDHPYTYMTIALGRLDCVMPAELVEFVTEPRYQIVDVTPWYVRLWFWLKRGWV